uniref:Sulfhydryl oxidase n=1 Tax=Pithovirus LCPAC102 TaxID=2506587 RepID=A0A4D5XFD9_9VIRU|nr:MAG: Erv1/Alr family disulfide (thiol) oxidoreductase [Pithovirus LCPAC102]
MEFPSESKIWGPGIWLNIHVFALGAITMDKIYQYIEYIKFIMPKLPCNECRNHAIEYIINNPLEEYINIKNEKDIYIGMFKWTWIFHNTINMRIRKNTIDYDTALYMYDDPIVCSSSCASDNTITSYSPNYN